MTPLKLLAEALATVRVSPVAPWPFQLSKMSPLPERIATVMLSPRSANSPPELTVRFALDDHPVPVAPSMVRTPELTTILPVKLDARPEVGVTKRTQPPLMPEVALLMATVPAPVMAPVIVARLPKPFNGLFSDSVAPELTVNAEVTA